MNDSWKRAEDWLRGDAEQIVPNLVPGGKLVGDRWVAASVDGGKGQSFSVVIKGDKVGVWGDFADGEKSKGTLLDLWRVTRHIEPGNHDALFRDLRSYGAPDFGWQFNDEEPKPPPKHKVTKSAPAPTPEPKQEHAPINWLGFVDQLDEEALRELAEYRDWPLAYCQWLKDHQRIGYDEGAFLWPIFDDGKVVGVHRFIPGQEHPWVDPKGINLSPLVWGDLALSTNAQLYESQWDAGAVQVLSGPENWVEDQTEVFIITRGVQHTAKLAGLLGTNITEIQIWPQNDEPGESWLKKVLEIMGTEGRRAHVVRLPKKFKDPNDFLRGCLKDDPNCVAAGDTAYNLQGYIEYAEVVEPPPPAPAAPSNISAVQPQSAYEKLLADLGPPFIRSPRSYSINQPFFARFFGINRLAFYDLKSKDYYAYTAAIGLYERLCQETVIRLLKEDIFAEASAGALPNVGSKISIAPLKSIAELIKSDKETSRDDFFHANPRALPIIHAANGMLRLEEDGTISRHDFSPEFRSRNMIPVNYDPDAQCPRFKTELLQPVLPDPDDIDALQRYCGLILIGGNRAQKILMLLGEGGTGKGTIVRLIRLVIGRQNFGELRINEINERFEASRLIGKLLLNIVEATFDCLEHRGAKVLKALSGHDPMDGEKKYVQDPVSFEGAFPIIYTSNEDPNIRLSGDETAWSRRMVVLLFPLKRSAESAVIDNFEEILFEEEAPGIFAWMIEGARKHWAELVARKGFSSTDSQNRRVEEIIARSKSITTFVLDGLEASGSTDLTTDELYDGYVSFCLEKKWHPYPERKFAEIIRPLIMKHFGIGKSHDVSRVKSTGKTATVYGYRGINVKIT